MNMNRIELNKDEFPKVSLEGLDSHKIAKMVDHSLLHPSMTDAEFEAECEVAKKYNVGAVCVKPYHVKRAAELMAGTDIQVSAVIAFPHGNSTTEIKLAEAEQVCRDGATEVDMVVNIGKVVGGDWSYVDNEIRLINALVKRHNAILKVIFENDMLQIAADAAELNFDLVVAPQHVVFKDDLQQSIIFLGLLHHGAQLVANVTPIALYRFSHIADHVNLGRTHVQLLFDLEHLRFNGGVAVGKADNRSNLYVRSIQYFARQRDVIGFDRDGRCMPL